MNAGSADREVSSIPGPTARIDGDLQREMLHILPESPDGIPGRADLLPQTRWHSCGREQSCSARFHFMGAVEAAQVSKNRDASCLNELTQKKETRLILVLFINKNVKL